VGCSGDTFAVILSGSISLQFTGVHEEDIRRHGNVAVRGGDCAGRMTYWKGHDGRGMASGNVGEGNCGMEQRNGFTR
jgi:hypothetical protein